ncbi:hypothetical protein [Aliivibrio fischeri]|uniref:hypothetical protein n=1 Tax=Aliivibrio fischeri TaxID=668 RepID=UPI00080EB29C|nr:hypothetical protein [Aliivibrio fischeri]OCH04845.1 hypothetical protein A6E09_18295 [Aliivibrio fischeri]
MFKVIRAFFKFMNSAALSLEKESEKMAIESKRNFNDYIESCGGIEEVEKANKKAEEYLKRMR